MIVEKLKLSISVKAVVEAAVVNAPGTFTPFYCNYTVISPTAPVAAATPLKVTK